jgi:nitrite reductase/ring-hydroxylating ferredoxin subunit
MADHAVAKADEISEGESIIVQLEGREIGVFKINGRYHAYTNWCGHQGGPVCEGPLDGTTEATFDRDTLETEKRWTKENEILVCPWHGWEFDATSGECLSDEKMRLPEHDVGMENGEIIVSL